ncbi:alpha/beta hydrolase [Mycolicibacterium fluoranthenivorans]|uniref:Pimeloyl-ACP methyl ester carboxylesterase n=1 Tax=Mycolicibacterium fluoranthenivorans TaxID=258505 RepID=A0A7X5U632_9MYCO|nr:alpha/beta hydrolase [Mycolicibacterium fluoranthenivorans]NIH99084.1 pimeloyl-ACP methyl ester carboxylesterase [Mycolicibacterium fluoranthenivorans]
MSRWGKRGMVVVSGIVCAVTLALTDAVPPAAATPGDIAEPGQALAWSSCDDWVDASRVPTAQCAALSVPVDWTDAANPQAAQVQLAVMRVPASGKRLGTIISNPGGPGVSAIDVMSRFAPKLAKTEIGRQFDLVAFDPRGVGLSTPEVRCETDAQLDEDRADPQVDFSPAGVAHIEDTERQHAQKCLDRVGAPFLAGMSTENTARDMDAVRAALGEEKLNFFGYSYGTRLGTAYAEQFPDRVRAMMLDGVVDQFTDPLADEIVSAAGFQQAFDAYASDCASQPDCPLGVDPAQSVVRFRELVDPLADEPARTADPRGLSYQDAMTGVDAALYDSEDWPRLTDGLTALARGHDADDLLELADEYSERDEEGHYANLEDAFDAVHCADDLYPNDPAVWAENDRAVRRAAPYKSYGEFTGFAPRPLCVFWPVQPTVAPHPVTSPGPGKVVVVSTTGDPATPYQVGVDVAAQLGAPLITFNGDQHTVAFSGNRCIDKPLEALFIDLTQPPADLHC